VSGKTGTAVYFPPNLQSYISTPYGNGVNPSTQSLTIALGVLPDIDATTGTYTVFAPPIGSNQRLALVAVDGTWNFRVQATAANPNTEFPVTAAWTRLCLVVNSGTDTATLHVNGVPGTSSESIRTYTSYSLAGNFDIGRVSGTTNGFGFAIDDFKLWTSAESCASDYAAWNPPSGGTGTLSQVAYQFYLLRQNPAGSLVKLPSSSSVVSTPLRAMTGSVLNLEIQTNCDNVSDCDPFSQSLQYDVNASDSWTGIAENCAIKVCFYGTQDNDPAIDSGIPTCPLSGVLNCVDGGTQRTAAAAATIDMAQNNSTVNRYTIKLNTSAGDVLRFRLVNQNGTVLNTYSQYPTVETIESFAGSAL